MIPLRYLPMYVLLFFTLTYAMFGDPDNKIWSGFYFLTQYITMFLLFKEHDDKLTRILGMSLSISILIFITLKFFIGFELPRIFTVVPLLICIYSIYKLEAR